MSDLRTSVRVDYVFEIPLRLSPTLNKYSRMHWTKRRQLKNECLLKLLSQQHRRRTPLEKPHVLATRFSMKKTDQDAAWTKVWMDCLKPEGMNLIQDDDPDSVEVTTRWRKAEKMDLQFVSIVVTGLKP